MAELPLKIVIKRFGMVCQVYALNHARKRVIATKPQRGYGHYKYMFCFMISHFILL